MSFYNRAHNGQTHSQPLLLGGKELVEQAVVHFSGNACAMIAHAQAHFAIAIASRANLYLAPARWRLLHGIKGITDQINQELLNLDRISFDQWQVLGQQYFYLAGVGQCIRSDGMCYFSDQLIQINLVPARIAFLNCVGTFWMISWARWLSATTSTKISRKVSGSSLPLSITAFQHSHY